MHVLSGIFNCYRPNGDGLERMLFSSGIEGEVLVRIKQVFKATSVDWNPSEIYFSVNKFPLIDEKSAMGFANDYLEGLKRFFAFIGDAEAESSLKGLRIVSNVSEAQEDGDLEVMVYECLTDFLSTQQPKKNEIFLLKEAIYSMANDYFLMAYLLWPAIDVGEDVGDVFSGYFDLWRHGLKLKFLKNGAVSLKS